MIPAELMILGVPMKGLPLRSLNPPFYVLPLAFYTPFGFRWKRRHIYEKHLKAFISSWHVAILFPLRPAIPHRRTTMLT